jgi:hypothetical protein
MKRLVALLSGVALLLLPGCAITYLTWDTRPRLHAKALLGVDFEEHDYFALGVERSDGDRRLYVGRIAPSDHGHLELADSSAVGERSWTYRANTAGDIVELPRLPGDPDGTPVTFHLDAEYPRIRIVDSNGMLVRWEVFLAGESETNWSHPGSWACAAAMPVTFALDVVLAPVELLLLMIAHPRC